VDLYEADPNAEEASKVVAVEGWTVVLEDGRRFRMQAIDHEGYDPGVVADLQEQYGAMLLGRDVLAMGDPNRPVRLVQVNVTDDAEGPICPLAESTIEGDYKTQDVMVAVLIPIYRRHQSLRVDLALQAVKEGLGKANAAQIRDPNLLSTFLQVQKEAREHHRGIWMTPDDVLIHVALRGRPKEVRRLLASGADPNASRLGQTALTAAILGGSSECVVLLLQAGADISKRVQFGYMPIHMAAQRGRPDLVKLLLQHGAKPNVPAWDGTTPLMIAAEVGSGSTCRVLLDRGASAQGVKLHSLVHRGQTKTIELLVKAGADPDALDNGRSALHAAASAQRHDMARKLLQLGANPNCRGPRGVTPLQKALAFHPFDAKLAAILLDAGADPTLEDAQGRSPMDGMESYSDGVCRLLEKHAADMETPEQSDSTDGGNGS
jgi:ankyrin repeat protein